jgi:hypothetical protein
VSKLKGNPSIFKGLDVKKLNNKNKKIWELEESKRKKERKKGIHIIITYQCQGQCLW